MALGVAPRIKVRNESLRASILQSRDSPALAGRNNDVSKRTPTCIRHRGRSGHHCGSGLGLFPICPDWTGRRPHRRRTRPRGRAMRRTAACLRKQRQARGAGRRKLPQIPGDLPTTGSEGCVRRIAASLSQQGQAGRTRRRELSPVQGNVSLVLTRSAPHSEAANRGGL
jgi:hypothetical protein